MIKELKDNHINLINKVRQNLIYTYYHQFTRGMGDTTMNELKELYYYLTEEKITLSNSCSTCQYNLMYKLSNYLINNKLVNDKFEPIIKEKNNKIKKKKKNDT